MLFILRVTVQTAISRFNSFSTAVTDACVSTEKFSSDKFGLDIKKEKTRVTPNSMFTTRSGIGTKLNAANCALQNREPLKEPIQTFGSSECWKGIKTGKHGRWHARKDRA